MIEKIINFALHNRPMTIVGFIAVLAFGYYSYRNIPIDAFPDISPVMVPVFAEADGLAPEEIERLIIYPVESAMNGLPDVTLVKSTSAFGMGVVYVYFKDNVDIYFARQLVAERLARVSNELPPGYSKPALGPISSGLGQIFIYYLTADPKKVDTGGKELNTYLRELNDWVVKFQLRTVPGVTDILSVGGHVLQYQIVANPNKLKKYNLSVDAIVDAVNSNNRNAGGQYLVIGSEEYLVRGVGLLKDLDDIRNITIKEVGGVPVTINDVARVKLGNALRRGVVTRNGEDEVVSGLVLKLYGENTSKVIDKLYKAVDKISAGLPDGVKLVPYYEQAELVKNANSTVTVALLQGVVLVLIVLALFLGSLKASLIVATAIPFSAALAIIAMNYFGISANLMSLGGIAIAIGMLVDGSIVVTENIVRHFSMPGNKTRSKILVASEAAREVGRPITFALLIIVAVFLPLYSLTGIEGKMFGPMASAICLALLGSIFAAIVAAPVLGSLLLGPHKEGWFNPLLSLGKVYGRLLPYVLKLRYALFAGAAIAVFFSVFTLMKLGTEFMPTLEEGSILAGVSMAPSISIEKATETVNRLAKKIMSFKEVDEVISRIGRPEAGSHPHPVNYAEIHIELKPTEGKVGFRNKKALVEALRKELGKYPGVQINFTQPIQNAFDELISGTRAQLAIKVYGEDLDILRKTAEKIRGAVKTVPGLVDLSVEQSFGQPQVKVTVDWKKAARYGVNGEEIMEIVETAVGGKVIDNIYLNTRRYGILLRYDEDFRSDPESIKQLLVHAPNNKTVTLEQVANVTMVEGPMQINREKNQRRWAVQGNIKGRALSHVIADIRKRIKEEVKLPPGYFVGFGGQFENQQRAMTRLAIIVPIVIAIIFFLLWSAFRSFRHAGIVMINVPLSLIGGVFGLWFFDEYLSVPASIGFIVLFGIAMQDAVVMIADFNQLREEGHSLREAVIQGCVIRFRPVVLTTLTTLLGLLPLLMSMSSGAEVQRPLAATVVFGLASSTLLTLLILPAFYYTVEKMKKNKKSPAQP